MVEVESTAMAGRPRSAAEVQRAHEASHGTVRCAYESLQRAVATAPVHVGVASVSLAAQFQLVRFLGTEAQRCQCFLGRAPPHYLEEFHGWRNRRDFWRLRDRLDASRFSGRSNRD